LVDSYLKKNQQLSSIISFSPNYTAAMTIDPTVTTKYQSGFGECAQEVQRYLGSIDGLSSEVRMRLMQHLSNCMNHVHQISSFGSVSVYNGVPCASPSHSLPGVSLRPLLPFGGLAMTSSDSSVLSVSPSSLYGSGDYSCCEGGFSVTPSSSDNRENTRSGHPLSEKPINLNHVSSSKLDLSPGFGDDNNNNVCVPPSKRRKMDEHDELSENHRNDQNRNKDLNLFDIKTEPVWRPW